MKTKIVLCTLVLAIGSPSFGACEYERERLERNNELCEKWSKASCYVAAGGAIIGACIFPVVGGLCGAIGLAPGSVAKRVCDLAKQKKEQLEACENGVVEAQKRAEEDKKDQLISRQASTAGRLVRGLCNRKFNELQTRLEGEIDALTERYIESGENLSDDTVIQRMQQEVEALTRRYF